MYFNSLRRKSQQLFVEQFSPLLNILSIPFGTVHKAVFFVLFQSQNFIQQRIISTVIYYKPPQRTSIQVLIESSHSSSLKKSRVEKQECLRSSLQQLKKTHNHNSALPWNFHCCITNWTMKRYVISLECFVCFNLKSVPPPSTCLCKEAKIREGAYLMQLKL